MTQSGDQLQPVAAGERIREVDMLRGASLFGVLLVNTQMFNDTLLSFSYHPYRQDTLTDEAVAMMIQILATGKFYTLFSFLFGLGFYLFMHRLETRGIKPAPIFRRRLFLLLLFGVLHMTFFWYGDILSAYALAGCLLICFWKKSPQQLKTWMLMLLSISTLLLAAVMASQTVNMEALSPAQATGYQDMIRQSIHQYQASGYWSTVMYRLQQEFVLVYASFLFWIPKVLALFLAGLYAGKTGFFQRLNQNRKKLTKYLIISGVIGWSLTLIYFLVDLRLWSGSFAIYFMAEAAREISTLALCVFYISGLLLLWQHPGWRRRLEPFEKMGRLALTHYITQSVLLTLIFYGHGLGLMHQISLLQGMMITFLIYIIQLFISGPYLKRFRQGPLEALWRKGTYRAGYQR